MPNNNPKKPLARAKKPLMSELLKDTRKYLEQAQQTPLSIQENLNKGNQYHL